MGIWILYFVVTFFLPIFYIIYGNIYRDKVPEDINGTSGYKTTMSRLNWDTWEFANHYYNKLMRFWGWILLVLSFVVTILICGRDENTVILFMAIVPVIQIIPILVCIAPTESALRKTFDENGHRR